MEHTLQDILGTTMLDKFLKECVGKHFLVLRGTPGTYSTIVGWPDINNILSHNQLTASQLQMTRESRPITPDTFMNSSLTAPSVSGLTACLRGGARLTIQRVDLLHESIGEIALNLEADLRVPIAIDISGEMGSRVCRDPRYETHETLILQAGGSTHWWLYEQLTTFPVAEGDVSSPVLESPLWEGILEDGDAIYIPRGCTYAWTPRGQPSLHLIVKFKIPTAIDMFRWLAAEVTNVQLFRGDLPLYEAGAAQDKVLVDLRSAVEELFVNPELIPRFFDQLSIPPRRSFNLPFTSQSGPWSVVDDMHIAVTNPVGLRYRWAEGRALMLLTRTHDSALCLDPAAEPLIEYLNTHRSVLLSELIEHFEESFDDLQIGELVQYLSDSGLLSTKAHVRGCHSKSDAQASADFKSAIAVEANHGDA